MVTLRLGLVAVVLLVTAGSACGRAGPTGAQQPVSTSTPFPTATPTPTPTPTPVPVDPAQVLRRSGEVMGNLDTFRFRLHHEKGSTQLLPQLHILEAEGDVINPDTISIAFEGSFAESFAVKSGLITVGEDSYMMNPLTGKWEAAQTVISPLGFFSPSRGILSMVTRVQQPRILSDPEADPEVYRIGGTVEAEAFASLLGPTFKSVMADVELTIDRHDMYMLRAVVSGKVIASDIDDVVRVIALSRFGEAMVIERPPVE